MATLNDLKSPEFVKTLFIGDSGTGKTGGLASLVKAGYSLTIADFDNGLHVLASLLTEEERSRVTYKTFTDKYKSGAGRFVPITATAWPEGVNWISEKITKGSLGTKDFFILDSGTFAAAAAMRYGQLLNGKLGNFPEWTDYDDAQKYIQSLCEIMYAETVRTNYIMISHINYHRGKKDEATGEIPQRGYASTIGKAFDPKIGRYFNNCIMARTNGSLRQITTVSVDDVELKSAAPSTVKKTYPLETGLATFVADLKKGTFHVKAAPAAEGAAAPPAPSKPAA